MVIFASLSTSWRTHPDNHWTGETFNPSIVGDEYCGGQKHLWSHTGPGLTTLTHVCTTAGTQGSHVAMLQRTSTSLIPSQPHQIDAFGSHMLLSHRFNGENSDSLMATGSCAYHRKVLLLTVISRLRLSDLVLGGVNIYRLFICCFSCLWMLLVCFQKQPDEGKDGVGAIFSYFDLFNPRGPWGSPPHTHTASSEVFLW